MKNILILLSALIVITSCGKSGSSGSPGKEINPLGTELTKEEKNLKDRLIAKGSIDQKELMSELLTLTKLTSNSLSRLDKVLEMKCVASSNICHISSKE